MKKILALLVTICLGGMLVAVPFMTSCAKPAPAPTPAPAPAPTPAPTPAPKTEPIELKAVAFLPPPVPAIKIFAKLVDAINERAKGELTIKFLGGPEVVPAHDLPLAVKDGKVDIGMVPTSYYEGLVPVGNVYLVSQLTHEEELQVGFHDLVREYHREAGLFYLGRMDPRVEPTFYWMIRKGVKKPETPYDLAGLKAAGTAMTWQPLAETLGMPFTVIKPPDAYTAMERGVVDIFCFFLSTHVSLGIHEVSSYCIDHPFYMDNMVIIINPDTWNGLPEHLQDLVMDVYIDEEPELIRLFREADVPYRQKALDAGLEFIKFSPADAEWFLETANRAMREQLIKQFPETAPRLLELITR